MSEIIDKIINGSVEITEDIKLDGNLTDDTNSLSVQDIANKADKVGALPHFNISNVETNVLDFITANNVAGKTIVLHIEGNKDDIIGIFVPVGSKYAFRFTWVSSNTIFQADAPVDLTNISWNYIFDFAHSPFKKEFEITNNKVTSLSASSTNTQYPSAKAVWDLVDGLPEPMLFKGSVGDAGDNPTITWSNLPAAASSNEGFTYKVITAHATAPVCKVGDTIISNGTSWVVIPSGDEPSGTVTSVGGTGASGSHISVTGGPITTSGTLTVDVESGYSIPSNEKQAEWDNLIETTYSALKTLRDNSQLIPGRFYRITDYQCTTVQANTSSAGHVFDIIVRADSTNKLSEEAWAAHHSGDTYFSNNKLDAWKIWYSLDNDADRFAWADSINGKGVIYRMIDEFNNDIPYDFKNILFTTSGKYMNAYSFSYTEDNIIKDASLLGLDKKCYSNIMKECIDQSKQELNFNVFYSTSATFNCYLTILNNDCHSNTFSYNCHSITFEKSCYRNTFGNNCYSNVFESNCSYNTFGNSCNSNTFENACSYNKFGNSCSNNTFGNSCAQNTFGNTCTHNKFGNMGQSNIFGDSCSCNTFGFSCSNNKFGSIYKCNIFGDDCIYITFGNSSSAINYCEWNIIDNGCCYLYINKGTGYDYLQNIHIHLGVKGSSSSNRKTITVDKNLPYETDVYQDSSGNLIYAVNNNVEVPGVQRYI